MTVETGQFYLAEQRRAVVIAAGLASPVTFEVRYTRIIPKGKLSGKAVVQNVQADEAKQYCIFDEKDRLVKPKKITKKGKTLRIDITDDHVFEIFNFFERDFKKEISPKFVSHINGESGNLEAIDAFQEELVELYPEQEVGAWCSRAGLTQAPDVEGEHQRFVAEDLRSSLNPVLSEPAIQPIEHPVFEVEPVEAVTPAPEVSAASLPETNVAPYLFALGIGALALRNSGVEPVVPVVPSVVPVVPSVEPDLVIQGRIMLGPVLSGGGLKVEAYDAAGNLLGSTQVTPTNDASGKPYTDYVITVSHRGTYTGPVTVRLINTDTTNPDYVSEYLANDTIPGNQKLDLGAGALLALAYIEPDSNVASTQVKTINITQATDLVARRFWNPGTATTPPTKTGVALDKATITAANVGIIDALFGPNSINAGKSIVDLSPESTVDASGNPNATVSSEYAVLLHSLDVYFQQTLESLNTAATTAKNTYDSFQNTADSSALNAANLEAAAKALEKSNPGTQAAIDARTAANAAATTAASDAQAAAEKKSIYDTAQAKVNTASLNDTQATLANLIDWTDPANPKFKDLRPASVVGGAASADISSQKLLVNIYQGVSSIGDDSDYYSFDGTKLFTFDAARPKDVNGIDIPGAFSFEITGGANKSDFVLVKDSSGNNTGVLTWKNGVPSTTPSTGYYDVIVTTFIAGLGAFSASQLLRIKVDATPPDNTDLNADTGQVNAQTYVNASEVVAGKSIAGDTQAPSSTDIGRVKIVLAGAGLDKVNDKLVLDSAIVLSADVTGSNVTIGTITGIDYKYDSASQTLTLTKNGGGALDATTIDDIVKAIKLSTTSTTQGDRTATISYVDLAGNEGTAAVSTLKVDTVSVSAAITVSDVQADGQTAYTETAPNHADKFLTETETNIVLKVDSTLNSTNSALKVGDVITLQVKDEAASTLAGTDVYKDLVDSAATASATAAATLANGTPTTDTIYYTYTVTHDDLADGNGPNNAAYIQINKTDLTEGVKNNIRAHVVDLAGNTSGTVPVGITVQAPILLTLNKGTGSTNVVVNDLEVDSNIVLQSSQTLASAGHKLITFTNKANDPPNKAGFDGENTEHTFTVYADDTRYVTVSGDKIIIKPTFDFDFANNYQITVEAGAFLTAADPDNDVPALETKAVVSGDSMNFNTVSVGADLANAVTGKVMQDDGTVVTGKKWFSVENTTQSLDLAGDAYVMVFKDNAASGQRPDVNDGVGTGSEIQLDVTNFGADDRIYADDQNNDLANLNNLDTVQIIAQTQNADQKTLHFDSSATFDGATFNLSSGDAVNPGGELSAQDITSRLNISNVKTTGTIVTGVSREDSANTILGAEITDAHPLSVKISADYRTSDTVQLVYIDANQDLKSFGTAYAVTASDIQNKYVLLSVDKTSLTQSLPIQDGYNKIYAKVTGQDGVVTYSPYLGGSNGVYFDAVAPVPTLNIADGQDQHLSSGETGIDLVIHASQLSSGDVLVLKIGTLEVATYTVDAAKVGQNATFHISSDQLAFGDPNTLTVTSTDAAGNIGTSSISLIKDQYIQYNGQLGLGPVVSGNDLRVTAYDKDGNVLGASDVDATGLYTLDIISSYKGAITLRASNRTSNATPDYFDEAEGKAIDIGSTGSIAAIVWADGSSKTVNISTLTDLVARQLSFGNASTATAEQVAAYNLKLAQLFISASATDGIVNHTPTFVVDASGDSTLSSAGMYGQLLAQISAQVHARSPSMSMVDVQAMLANAITMSWDASTGVVTTNFETLANQVVLLSKVAQAASLTVGADASAYLTAADFQKYGFSKISALSTDRQNNFIAQIVASDDDGSKLRSITDIDNLAAKVIAQAKVQDYAASGATNPAPTLADYVAAGFTGVTANNLISVNKKVFNNSTIAGSVPDVGLIQTVIDTGVSAQTAAINKIANYQNNVIDAAGTTPTLSDYATAGLTGVDDSNLLKAVNTAIHATSFADSSALAADIQASISTAVSTYTHAFELIRAYMLDHGSNAEPSASTYAAIGLSSVDSSSEVASANYYLTNVLTTADIDLANATLISKLTAQQNALVKINDYAVNGDVAPKLADYLAAGVLKANSANYSDLGTAVDAQDSIADAATLASILAPVFDGQPSLISINRSGTTVSNGAFQNDRYLNAAELSDGQKINFTVTFDRSVTGLKESDFALVDASDTAIAGVTPSLVLTSLDQDAGKVWQVAVSDLTGLSNASLKLNLVSTSPSTIVDFVSGKSLTNPIYKTGQSYAVDKENNFTVSAAVQSDLTLDSAEASVDLYVSPQFLTVGDVLRLTKDDGTQLGSDIVVTQSHLVSGVTFAVLKTSLSTGANVLTVTSTDVAGNQGSASATVTVSEYVNISGQVGLPSKISATHDLTITAYDASGHVLGTGAIDAATNTYALSLLKTQSGIVTLKIASQNNGFDYYDANGNLADLGFTSVSATLNANGAAQTINVTLLTDLASRLISGLASASSADVGAINTAITQLLINSASNVQITAWTPDFVLDGAGSSTVHTASLYGQLMAQLSQQAKLTNSSLDVVLANMAKGISWNGTEATLTSTLAKQVVILAKAQLAASLSAGADASAYLTTQNLIDAGVTDFADLTTARQSDVIRRIVASTDDASSVNTYTKLVALVDQVKALGIIQDYKTLSSTAPSLTTYQAAGFTDVTATNLVAINNAIRAATGDISSNPDTVIGAAVTAGINAQANAFSAITAYASSNTATLPTVSDYLNAGVVGVNATNIVAVNLQVDALSGAGLTNASLQTAVNAGVAACSDAITALKAYITSTTASAPTLAVYQAANLASIATEAHAQNANYLLKHVLVGQALTDQQLADKLAAQMAAIDTLNTYASTGASLPTLSTYANAGFSQVTANDLSEVNARVNTASAMGTVSAILSTLQAIDLNHSKLDIQSASAITLNASTALDATPIFSGVAKTYTDDIASIKISVAGSGVDEASDRLVFGGITQTLGGSAKTGASLTLNTVTGISWAYNSAKQLILTKTDGSLFTAAQAQLIEQAIQFQTLSGATQGQRTFTLAHLDANGQTNASATNTVTVDSTMPTVDNYNTTLGAAGQLLLPSITVTDTGVAYSKIVAQFKPTGLDYGVATTYQSGADFLAIDETVSSVANANWNATTGTLTLTSKTSEWTLDQAQQVLRAIQYVNTDALAANSNIERHININLLDSSAANSLSILTAVKLAPSVDLHSASFDPSTEQITLNFEAALSGAPQLADFSDIKLDDVATSLTAVNTSGASLLLTLASAATQDAVISFNYTSNASAVNQIQSAAATLQSFAFLLDKAANNNSSLVGSAGKHNTIMGNGGADTMTGAELADTFVFGAGTTGTSHVTNFSLSQADKLDLSQLIQSYSANYGTNSLSKYLNLSVVNSGQDLQLQIDQNGLGNFTSGLDATVVLDGVGLTATNAGIANNSAELTHYLLKASTLVI